MQAGCKYRQILKNGNMHPNKKHVRWHAEIVLVFHKPERIAL
jgi:hypothetical protein